MTKITFSSDSEGLGFCHAGAFTVGYVPEVNGAEAAEVPEFVATKHELIQLVKYWYGRKFHNTLYYFFLGQSGSSEWRTNKYAERRLDRIGEYVPEKEFSEAIEETEREFKKNWKISDEDWDTFKNGSEEDWQRVQERVNREWESKHQRKSRKRHRVSIRDR
jgi:hypothetical protein